MVFAFSDSSFDFSFRKPDFTNIERSCRHVGIRVAGVTRRYLHISGSGAHYDTQWLLPHAVYVRKLKLEKSFPRTYTRVDDVSQAIGAHIGVVLRRAREELRAS